MLRFKWKGLISKLFAALKKCIIQIQILLFSERILLDGEICIECGIKVLSYIVTQNINLILKSSLRCYDKLSELISNFQRPQQHAAECHYNSVQLDMTLFTVLQQLRQNIYQSVYLSLMDELWGVCCEDSGRKIYHMIITAPHCIMPNNTTITYRHNHTHMLLVTCYSSHLKWESIFLTFWSQYQKGEFHLCWSQVFSARTSA